MESLYNITGKFIELFGKDDLTEEDYNELGKELAIELKDKSANIVGYIRDRELYIDAMKSEEKRIAEIRKSLESKLDNFKEYVKQNMEALELEKIETPIGILSLAKNPMSVEIVDEEIVPNEFKKVIQEIKIDKIAIKEYFKNTGEIPNGINIIDNKKSIRIK